MSTLELVLLSTACSFLATGLVVLRRARNHLRPDEQRSMSIGETYYQLNRFTPEGRRLLVRSWVTLLVGIGLAVALALV
jgi:hypothetical protein